MQHDLLFQGLGNTWWFWFAAICCLAAGVLIAVLMRYERQLVSRRVGLTLLALRLAVVATMFVTFLEPVVSSTLDKQKAGRIVVAVDVSESMRTADRFATKAELLRWARALEMIGNQHNDEQVSEWMRAYEAEQEPEWVKPSESADEGRRRELARIRKEHVERLIEQMRTIPRREVAKRLLLAGQQPLLAQLEEIAHVEIKLFAGRSESIDRRSAEPLLTDPPTDLDPRQSDLSSGLDVSSADVDVQPIGAVLLTEGRHNTEQDPVQFASRLGAINVPVFPVMIGSTKRPRDISIVSVEAPQVAFLHDKPVVRAKIAVDGYDGEELSLTLEKPDGQTEIKRLTVPASQSHAVLEADFTLSAEELGRQNYSLRVEQRPDETRPDNNSRAFSTLIVDDKARVFLADGEARWEFRFINSAYERDSRVELKQVVFEQPFIGVLPETFYPRRLKTALPQQADKTAFSQLDLVIMGDVPATEITPAVWDALEVFVRDEGGTLILMAGKNYFPSKHQTPSLARLFPMQDLRLINLTQQAADLPPSERGFRLKLTPDGERQTMFQLDTEVIANRNLWSQLPGHTWGIVGEARPSATVFASARPTDQADLADERKNAVIVHQYYGFGQVVWMGIDSTWRWRHRVGDKHHHRFWGQMARWAAENKASAGNEFVRLNLKENPIAAGQEATVTARWEPRFHQQHPELKAFIEVFAENDKAFAKPLARQPLQAIEGRAFMSEGRLSGLNSGAYTLRLKADGVNLGTQEVTATLYVQEPVTGELSDLSANQDLLEKLATASHGKLILPDEVRSIPSLIRPPELRTETKEERTLWDHWLMLTLFFALLTAEWVVRKLNGLP